MLVKPPAHGERIIALWALDCAYCEGNLETLAALQRAHPDDIELVTVATDSYEQHDMLLMHLKMAHVENYPARAYADATPDRINFLLDPSWGGETPRVLVIRADGSRIGISGELGPANTRNLL
jgi:iron complex outermembrane receptor protein